MSAEHTWFGHRCGRAVDDTDIDGCLAVLEDVRIRELRRGVNGSALASHAFGGNDVEGSLLYVRSSDPDGDIVGCIRTTPAVALADVDATRDEYRIDLLPPDHLGLFLILTRLAVRADHRGSLASLALLAETFAYGFAKGFGAALLACEPGLLGLYGALGAKPLGPARQSPSGGFRVPMVCIPDLNVPAVDSPIADALAEMDGRERAPPVQRWYERHVREVGEIATRVRPIGETDRAADSSLTDGMSPGGIDSVLKNAQIIGCEAGDRVLASDDGSDFVGFVVRGAVEISRDGQSLAVLTDGEMFGELAFVRRAPRSADVIALSDDTEVLLLSRKAVARIPDRADELVVWQNLARCIADRLEATSAND